MGGAGGGGGGGGGGVHMNVHMGIMVERYRSLALLIIFVVCQVLFLGVYDNCVKNEPNSIPIPHKYISLKSCGMDYI